jgi:hypothetical protein
MWLKMLLKAALFIAFVPGVLVTLPSPSSGRWTILIVHALLFVVVSKLLWRAMKKM